MLWFEDFRVVEKAATIYAGLCPPYPRNPVHQVTKTFKTRSSTAML